MVEEYIYDLLDRLEEQQDEKKLSIGDYVQSCILFTQYHKYHKQKQIIQDLSSSQKSQGHIEYREEYFLPLYLLYAFSSFCYIQNCKNIKKYRKQIRKSILCLQNHLDSTYLLFKNINKEFILEDHCYFLSVCSRLTDLLNEVGMHKEADTLFMIKGKIELGFKRYFVQSPYLVSYFSPSLMRFEFAENQKQLECMGLLQDEVPRELDYETVLQKFPINSLTDELLLNYCKMNILREQVQLSAVTMFFLKKGAGEIVSKNYWGVYKKTYQSLFFEKPLSITTKKSSFYGIPETIHSTQLIYALYLLK